jgi:hypothetical protein
MLGRRLAREAAVRRRSRRPFLERLEDRTVLSTWVEQGPGPILGALVEGVSTVTGAVEALVTDPHHADIVFAGTVNGGVWKTTNATAASPSWTPLTDLQLPGLSINSVAISPANSNTLFAGTGSVSSLNIFATNPGIGLARSTDGGSTWALFASDTLARQNIRSVVPTALDSGHVVLIATEFVADPRYRLVPGDAGGVYRSNDNGEHFTRISGAAGTGLPDQAVSDLVADPSNPNRFYAAVPAPYTSAPTGHEGVFKSEDGGLTWAPVNTGLTGLSTSLRILLAVHNSSGNDVLYADVIGRSGGLQGVYRTADLGANWASMGLPSIDIYPGRQGWIHGAVVADPHDPNVVFISGDGDYNSGGVVETGVLVRGDASKPNPWTSLLGNDTNKTAPHADSRVMVFDAHGDLLQGDDGGIYRLVHPNDKATRRWVDVNGNLATVEFHSIAYDPVSNILFGGTQDNGSPEQVTPGGTTWNDFQAEGDGGKVAVDADQTAHSGTSVRYSSYQYFDHFIRRTVDASNVVLATDPVQLKIVAGAGKGKHLLEFDPGIGFYQQFVLNTIDPSRMLIGTTYLYESFDRGDTLTNLGSLGTFVDGGDNGQAPVGRALAYGGRLNGVAYPDVIYAGAGAKPDSLNPGHGAFLFHRVHVGDPLTQLSAYPGDSVFSLVIDPQDYRRVYVNDINSRVWSSFDEGASWSELTANIHDLNPYAFVAVPIEIYSPSRSTDEDILLLGSLGGVFEMVHPDQPGAQWALLGDGLPHTYPAEIHYDYTDHVLVAGTLGRGAWTLDNPFAAGSVAPASEPAVGSPSSGIATSGMRILQLPITIPSGQTAGDVIWLNENAASSDTGFTASGVPARPRRTNPFRAERPVVWHSVNSGPTDLGAKAGNGPVPQAPPALPNHLFSVWLADDGTFNLPARKKLSKSPRR